MPDLEHSLQGRDLGFLRIVAGAWGIELNAPDTVTALPVVVHGILENNDFAEVIEALPADAREALSLLLQNEGRMSWAALVRKYGEVRRMGSARRDRERPELKPASAVEALWYRGLIGRAFMNLPPSNDPHEYAYIPDDLLPLLPQLRTDAPPPLGRPATPNEAAHPLLVDDSILDHACTLLAALRLKMEPAELQALDLGGTGLTALTKLLHSIRLLDYDNLPQPDRTRAFLEAPRGKAMVQMAQNWMQDPKFNELRLLPGLKFEGDWKNDPLRARQAVLELVSQIPENRWWSITAFIAAVRETQPDFQRPAGDYDSWFIRREDNGEYLRGFAAWDAVEGVLIRYLICGPMHWLGLVDLAVPEEGGEPSAMRLSRWAEALWNGSPPEDIPLEDGTLRVTADGRLSLPANTPRALRYQVARFCAWENENANGGKEKQPAYHYRITPAGLERAKSQGLRANQLVGLLRRHAEKQLAPALVQALEHWEQSGTQAVIERAALLRVTSAEILAALRKTRAARCLGEALNETTVIVRPGMEEQLLVALVETGYLGEAKLV